MATYKMSTQAGEILPMRSDGIKARSTVEVDAELARVRIGVAGLPGIRVEAYPSDHGETVLYVDLIGGDEKDESGNAYGVLSVRVREDGQIGSVWVATERELRDITNVLSA